MLAKSDIRTVIERKIAELIAEENAEEGHPDGAAAQDSEARPVDGQASLHELGLGSLTLARLVIELEMEFGVDPFADEFTLVDVRSVDELVDAYTRTMERRPEGVK